MPGPGAEPIREQGQDAIDIGGGLAATRYSDGSVVIWRIAPPNDQVGVLEAGDMEPIDLGDGRQASLRGDGWINLSGTYNPGGQPNQPSTGMSPPDLSRPMTPGVPGSGRGPAGEQLWGTTQDPFRGSPSPGVYSNLLSGMPSQTSGSFPGGWFDAGGNRHFIGRDDEGGPLGWGPEMINAGGHQQLGRNPVPGASSAGGSGAYYGAQPYQFITGTSGMYGYPAAGPGPWVGLNASFGSGGQGDPTGTKGLDDSSYFGQGSRQQWGDWVYGNNFTGQRSNIGAAGGGGWDQAWLGSAVPAYQMPPVPQSPGFGFTAGAPGQQMPQAQTNSGGWGQRPGGGGGDPAVVGGGGIDPAQGLFDWGSNLGGDFSVLAALIGRSDTPTGLGTTGIPPAYVPLVKRALELGVIKATNRGWAFLSSTFGLTPAQVGGLAPGYASMVGVQANGQGASPTSTYDGSLKWLQQPTAGAGGNMPGGIDPNQDPIAAAIANANAANAADRAAYWAYQQAMIRQGDEKLAQAAAAQAWEQTFTQAKFDFEKAISEAGLTGMYNGQETMAARAQRIQQALSEAGLTGIYNGQETLQAQNQKFQQALAAAGLTGMYNGQQTLQAKQLENQTAMGLMGLQAQLQGPRNWARYQSTFNATPQGLRDVMASFAGRYELPGAAGATSTAQGGRQSVAGLGGDILSGTFGQDGTQQPQAMGNPRQADLRNWNRMMPSQREMILGQYENEGWYGPDVENMLKQAAPRYAGASSSSYNM